MPRRGGGARRAGGMSRAGGGAGRSRQMRRSRRRRRRRRVLLVGGLVAFGAYKMSKKDADRIEEHTGVNPEELDDAELEQAMQELNIEKQSRTAEDVEQPGTSSTGAAGVSTGYLEEIEKLGSLRDAGILTDEEFATKKSQILGLN